jgi:hypothetical protein
MKVFGTMFDFGYPEDKMHKGETKILPMEQQVSRSRGGFCCIPLQ